MERTELKKAYNAIIEAMRYYNIDTSHKVQDSSGVQTTFYFRDCCGNDIVDMAMKILNA